MAGNPCCHRGTGGSSQIDWCQLAMEALLSYSPSEPPTPLFSRLTHFLKLCSKYFTEKVEGTNRAPQSRRWWPE